MHRIFTACVLLSACVVFAQSPAATWTIDDVILTEDAGAFAVSPDGERAVFLHVVPEPAKDKKSTRLAMVHLRDGTSRPLLRGDDDAAAPSFSPDGKHVAFLAARTSAIPETAGDAARYFTAGDPSSLADALDAVIGDADLRADLRLRGFERARDFTWDACARRHADLYLSLA